MADSEKDKKWKKIWKDRKYEILSKVRRSTPQNAGDAKNGLSIIELSDLVDLPPRETQDFVRAIIDWGANIYVDKNRVQTHYALAVTQNTFENLINFKKVKVMGQLVECLHLGVISDTQFGSTRTNVEMLRAAYRHFEEEKVTAVLHVGNILQGIIPMKYRAADQISEKLEDQLQIFTDGYPKIEGLTTYFILGHTDCTYEKLDLEPGSHLRYLRPDFNYLGIIEADLVFHPENKKSFRVRMYNEKLYYYYGISYQPQKKLENMAGGDKPNIWLVGGTQQEWDSRYQDVEVLKLPGLQEQTMRMRDRAYLCNTGYTIINVIPTAGSPELYTDGVVPIMKRPSFYLPRKSGKK